MAQINFYHLTRTPLEKALPKLLEKVFTGGKHTLVLAPDNKTVEHLNQQLWSYTTLFFLPHGGPEDGYKEEQPIYLTVANENPNEATILAMVGDAQPERLDAFEKCIYMFDGTEETSLQAARRRWKEYGNNGHKLTYWQQNAKGGWEQKTA